MNSRGIEKKPNFNSFGFTLVELVVTLVIIGTLAAVALPRFFSKPVFDVSAYFNQAQAIVRYGQKLAIARGTNVYVLLNGSSVALCYDNACNSKVSAPSGSNSGTAVTLAACGNTTWYCEAPASGVTYTAMAGSTSYVAGTPTFFFSAQGKPYNNGDTAPLSPVSHFTSLLTVTVSGNGSTQSFDVAPETGYVYHN